MRTIKENGQTTFIHEFSRKEAAAIEQTADHFTKEGLGSYYVRTIHDDQKTNRTTLGLVGEKR